jgi:hypothetical protein
MTHVLLETNATFMTGRDDDRERLAADGAPFANV